MEYIKEFFKIIGVVLLILLGFVFLLWPLALEGTGYFWIGGVYYGVLILGSFAMLAYVNVQDRR